MISKDVSILTRKELDQIKQEAFNRGVERRKENAVSEQRWYTINEAPRNTPGYVWSPDPKWSGAMHTMGEIVENPDGHRYGAGNFSGFEITHWHPPLRKPQPGATSPSPTIPPVNIDEAVTAMAVYLAKTVRNANWKGLRNDGRAKDAGFEPFAYTQYGVGNARQEDYKDVVREMLRIGGGYLG